MCTGPGTAVTASASANIYDEATLIALDMGDEVQLYHTLVYPLIWHHKWCVATLLGELHLSGHGLDLRTNLIAGGSRVPPRHLPRSERAQLPRLAGRRFGCARAAPLTTRRRRLCTLWLEPSFDLGRNQRLLGELRVAVSGFYVARGRCVTRGRAHGRMAACGIMPMWCVGGVG